MQELSCQELDLHWSSLVDSILYLQMFYVCYVVILYLLFIFITWRCLLLSCRAMRLPLQPKGIRTETLARTDEMESFIASMMKCVRGVMTGKEKINENLPKASY